MTDMGRYDHYTDSFIQEPCECMTRDIEEIREILETDCDSDKKCKMISNIINGKPHYFEKTGRWIIHNTGHSIYYDCSLCGCSVPCTETADKILWKMANYCPDCGAKMEG